MKTDVPPSQAEIPETKTASLDRIRIARSREDVNAIVPAWQRLYESARERNPFANPDVQLAWFDQAPSDIRPFVIQRWRDGQLDWIAPMHLAPVGPAGVFGRCLMPFAAHTHDWLIELAPVLSRIDPTEAVQEVVSVALDHQDEWTWTELTLAPAHGWLSSADDSRFPQMGKCRVMHKDVRTATVMELADTWEATRAGLKRNVRKSLTKAERKAVDTLGVLDFQFASESGDVEGFARRLVAMNLMRADSQTYVDHTTPFRTPANAELLVDTICRTVATKSADVIELRDREGRTVASQFTPYGDDTTFTSHSGFDPAHWDCSPMTLLTAKAVQRAIELGHDQLVLSPGPHVSKSRWSSTLEGYNTFLVVGGGRADRMRFLAYWVASSIRRFVQEGDLRRG
jgi:CelD/BcsL family acetyltransferase involved in cellulose biosynthesis